MLFLVRILCYQSYFLCSLWTTRLVDGFPSAMACWWCGKVYALCSGMMMSNFLKFGMGRSWVSLYMMQTSKRFFLILALLTSLFNRYLSEIAKIQVSSDGYWSCAEVTGSLAKGRGSFYYHADSPRNAHLLLKVWVNSNELQRGSDWIFVFSIYWTFQMCTSPRCWSDWIRIRSDVATSIGSPNESPRGLNSADASAVTLGSCSTRTCPCDKRSCPGHVHH